MILFKMEEHLTPKRIVEELNKYIISQREAKRAVAIAIRNRYRRRLLPDYLVDEVAPKNIIMIGPTGVGKTEIARRLANLVQAPFSKVEASKFTEVGYVGRGVESMIRDLVGIAVSNERDIMFEEVRDKAEELAEERILDILLPPMEDSPTPSDEDIPSPEEMLSSRRSSMKVSEEVEKKVQGVREKLREQFRKGLLDKRMVEIDVQSNIMPTIEIFSGAGLEEMGLNLGDMLGGGLPSKKKTRKVTVEEAYEILTEEEASRLIDMDKVVERAIERVEQGGIIFLDELDKIAGRETSGQGPDVSREGVQRDLLPIIEGTTVMTKYGMVKTDHILFIAAGAFHVSKPSDLVPELQGRFPIRVELKSLNHEDFIRILKEPKNALIKQYEALMETEDIDLDFKEDAIEEIARLSAIANDRMQNIGARRLHTVMEKLLEDISFDAPELSGGKFVIDAEYVTEKLEDLLEDEDTARYIL